MPPRFCGGLRLGQGNWMKVEFSAFPKAFAGNVAVFVGADKQLLATAQSIDAAAGGAVVRAFEGGRFAGAKGQKFDATPEGLKGKVIGVQVSTIHAAYAKKHFGSTAAEIKEYQTQDEANQDLAAGRIDATQADQIALDAFLQSDQGKAC
eukprot:gene45120-60245_t